MRGKITEVASDESVSTVSTLRVMVSVEVAAGVSGTGSSFVAATAVSLVCVVGIMVIVKFWEICVETGMAAMCLMTSLTTALTCGFDLLLICMLFLLLLLF